MDEGISDELMEKMAQSLLVGQAILFQTGGSDNLDLVLEKLSSFEGEVIKSDLPDEVVEKINEALKRL